MSDRIAYAVLGAGPAGTRAAETLRRADPDGRVVVVSADPHPFYNRILLSKAFLKSDAVEPGQVVLAPAEAYARRGIELRTGVTVTAMDPAAREIRLDTGETLAFEKALIATGARPAPLPVPGGERARTLRSLDDAIALREAAGSARRAVVVGGGLIGVEVACALVERGAAVTLLAREEWLFGHLAPEPVGRALEAVLAEGGVELALGRTVVEVEPADGGERVRTASGESFEAPLVVAGVGVRYNVDFLEGTGLLEPGRGVRANAYLETDAEGVWAAGDVAAFDDPVLGSRRHVEHWLHAQRQGRHAARNMAGAREPYAEVSSYDTELFGVPVVAIGAPEAARAWSASEGLEAGSGVALGTLGDRPVAAFRIGDPPTSAAELTERIEAAARERGAR